MDAENVLIETNPVRRDVEFLEDQINTYNIARTGVGFGGFLAIFVRDDKGEIVAGVYGYTWGDCCQIELLWFQEALRGQGIGKQLLLTAEQEALKRGCKVATLDTHSFQAPGFYQKLGYQVIGQVEDYPLPEYRLIYLKKQLIDQPLGGSPDESCV
jgi:GNAT superfamily N-acetyltransferase